MTDKLIPEGFRKLDVADEFVGLIGPLWFKAEGERLRVGLPLEARHGNPMGWAHGGLLVTVADMVMGAGSGHITGIRWPHPTISLSTEFVRGAKLGQWLEGTARIARRTINFCFCSCDLVCGGEIVLVASGVFKVPDIDKIPKAELVTKVPTYAQHDHLTIEVPPCKQLLKAAQLAHHTSSDSRKTTVPDGHWILHQSRLFTF